MSGFLPNRTGGANSASLGAFEGLSGGKFQGTVGGRCYPVHQTEAPKKKPPEEAEPPAHGVERSDGAVFSSVKEAARLIGVKPANLYNAIKRGGTCQGWRWRRVGEPWGPEHEVMNRPVRRLEDGRRWPSIHSCAISIGRSASCLRDHIKNGVPLDGYHYRKD